MAVQQGHSKRRGGGYRPHFVWAVRTYKWVLANGKAPTVFPTSEEFLNVEPLSEARTKLGKRRVSARRGRAGEKDDFFSILLGGVCSGQDRISSG
jgi:hypothetical protein